MIEHSDFYDYNGDDKSGIRDFDQLLTSDAVPQTLDITPDGKQAVVIGDVEDSKDYNHMQGDNDYGFKSTCGLVSCEDVLRQFGVDINEDVVVDYAVRNGLCNVGADCEQSGGTTTSDQAQILTDMGIPSHSEVCFSQEELASHIEAGQSVIAGVNAGVLWNDANYYNDGSANHAVVVTGVARDPQTGEIQGFYINDSGRGFNGDSGRFIDAQTMQHAWQQAGGTVVVTDIVK